jgi:hypothetical protein
VLGVAAGSHTGLDGTPVRAEGRWPVDDVWPPDRIGARRGGAVSEDRLKVIA